MIEKEEVDRLSGMHYGYVFSICICKLNHLQDAEDATQKVFQIFTEKAPLLEAEGIKRWLGKTAVYVILNEYTRRKRELERTCPYDDDMEELYKRASRFEDAYLDLHYEEFFEGAYEDLGNNDKVLFDYLSDGRIKEGKIAKKLDISDHACYMRKKRLKNKVKKNVSEKMIF